MQDGSKTMQVQETLSEGLRREFRVTVLAAELDAKLDQRLVELKNQVQIRGFRPGKVPVGHRKRIYGRTAAATPLVAIGGALELGLSAIGAGFGGLAGLGAGFLLAACIEGVAMLPAVVQTAAVRPEQANPDADASLEQIGFEAEVAA